MPTVREIFERAGKRPRASGRSPLYRWMRTNYAEFARALETDRPSWEALCAEFAAAGLTDRTGKPPSPATARKTWERVSKDAAAARARAEAKRKTSGPTPPPPATKATAPAAQVPCPPRRAENQKLAPELGSTAADKIEAARASLRAREIPIPERINPRKPKDK